MPRFDGPWGIDGWRYRRTSDGWALEVRHATFWSALWNHGLSAAMRAPADRPLEGVVNGNIGWTALGNYRGETGAIYFHGPMSSEDVRLIARSLPKQDGAPSSPAAQSPTAIAGAMTRPATWSSGARS